MLKRQFLSLYADPANRLQINFCNRLERLYYDDFLSTEAL